MPVLVPCKTKKIDLSAEWEYGRDSYISAGFFHNDVSNFISTTLVDSYAFGLTTPVNGPRWQAAQAALGQDATVGEIRQYIITNFPDTVTGPTINAAPGDTLLNFETTQPTNSEQTEANHAWENTLQHSFRKPGFGVILNDTIVNGNTTKDNTP